ncbi:SRPBCC domain-containing protein [Undibacterium sp. SXout20W]|uniref:SRPBCC domain-containing protein n=1 Tax=Undibacterium sp. SXout20W TaxID=3413051 RepID=UPI003BF04C20
MKINVDVTVQAPLESVWRAYTSPDVIKIWNAASDDWQTTNATVDLRVGGNFSFKMEAKDGSMGFDFSGVYTHIDEYKFIAYSFGDRTAQITFDNTSEGIHVTVTFDAETTYPEEQQRHGWQAILMNFKKYVESR